MTEVDPRRAAVLALDLQSNVVSMFGKEGTDVVHRVASVLDGARSAGALVVFIRVAFRPGYPEISPNNKMFATVASSGRLQDSDPTTNVHRALMPRADEPIVTKTRVSAFSGSCLGDILRAGCVDTLVVTGLSTTGVVLSTVRQAADLDFRLVILSDCCADGNADVHRLLMEHVFPTQGEVIESDGLNWR